MDHHTLFEVNQFDYTRTNHKSTVRAIDKMCGVAGFFGRYEKESLAKMLQRIRHRGPDGTGTHFIQKSNFNMGLCHARLSILDLSDAGHQPFQTYCPKCQTNHDQSNLKSALVYNGEIYNFKEIRSQLEKEGHRFTSQTDSEILLHLYNDKGIQMASELNGIFAFAIWDPDLEQLFLVKDPMGVKPMYVHKSVRGISFASEMKALLDLPDFDRELSPAALEQYLSFLWAPAPLTPFKSVTKLHPGEILKISTHGVQSFQIEEASVQESKANTKELIEELRSKLRSSVSRQLISDVPVGAFLSGGLDSSSIVAFMREARPQENFKVYSLGFSQAIEGAVDDLPFARIVAEKFDLDLNEIHGTSEFINRLPELVWHLDEPQADPAAINSMIIAEAAKRDGIKVLLNGAGADDLFTGYRRHQAVQILDLLKWIPFKKQLGMGASHFEGRLPSILGQRIAKALASLKFTDDESLVNLFYWSPKGSARKLLSPEFRSQLDGQDSSHYLLKNLKDINGDSLSRVLHLEQKNFLSDHNLNYTDKSTMAFGVETRVPLIDLELVRFAKALPSRFKMKGLTTKWIFRKAMEGILPDPVIYRKKTGFGVPLKTWVRKDMKAMLSESFERIDEYGVFDKSQVLDLKKRTFEDGYSGEYSLYAILSMQIWLDQFTKSPVESNKSTTLNEIRPLTNFTAKDLR